MSKERFLLWMLASIFTYQAVIFAYGIYQCAKESPVQSVMQICPDIGKRYDTTFSLMVATTLALLTGSTLKDK